MTIATDHWHAMKTMNILLTVFGSAIILDQNSVSSQYYLIETKDNSHYLVEIEDKKSEDGKGG